ncbi:unnamed protein product [Blepharisma stoltei]|uniref:chitin synthase n=1 Tax=Blepharisma stoltei TaxID=1481888 RepID=A0AAU9K0Q8_9CILI|nr:unnamed protein product [Blepharisma stoltei]
MQQRRKTIKSLKVVRLPRDPYGLVTEENGDECGDKALGVSEEMVYQPMKLMKHMTNHYYGTQQIRGLSKVEGLTWIPPDRDFRQSIFTELLYDYVENMTSKVEILIGVSMQDEDAKSFKNTVLGISGHLEEFRKAGISPDQVCCVVIIDGMKPFIETYLKQKFFFAQFFDEERIKAFFNVSDVHECKIPSENEEDEFAHCFIQNAFFDNCDLGLQMIFCVKQKTRRKLNSHLWLFGGFCEMFNPNIVFLMDAGTKPAAKSLFYLYEALKVDNDLAGCCGEIKPVEENNWNLVGGYQAVEYKFEHIFGKTLESLSGFVTKLPSAFCAYRWEALQGDPLWKEYFKSICHPEMMDAFHANIYLAEDRVLCHALVTKKNSSYKLRYVWKAAAGVEIPKSLAALMAQRRRWINGSWFSLIDMLRHTTKIFKTNHNCLRKLCFTLQMGYYMITVLFSWFLVGSYFLAMALTVRKVFPSYTNDYDQSGFGNWVILIYVGLVIIVWILALSVKPRRLEDGYKILSAAFGGYIFFTIGIILYDFITLAVGIYWLGLACAAIVFLFFFDLFIHNALSTVCKGIFHYIFLIPTHVNIFLTYAICNMHDISWEKDTEPLKVSERARLDEYEEFRAKWSIIWVTCNASLAYFFNLFDKLELDFEFSLFYYIAIVGIFIMVTRCSGSLLFVLQEACCKRKMEINKDLPPVVRQKKRRYTAKKATVAPDQTTGMDDPATLFANAETPRNFLADDKWDSMNLLRSSTMTKINEFEIGGVKRSGTQYFSPDQRKKTVIQTITVVDPLAEITGQYLRAIRMKKNLTIKQVSKMTGIRKYRLKIIENGIDRPTREEAQTIKNELGEDLMR